VDAVEVAAALGGADPSVVQELLDEGWSVDAIDEVLNGVGGDDDE
jgi:hypothetical protein